jgi:hypothetical protein
MAKQKTQLISVILPKPLVERLEQWMELRRDETNNSIKVTRTSAIQELLHSALENVGL